MVDAKGIRVAKASAPAHMLPRALARDLFAKVLLLRFVFRSGPVGKTRSVVVLPGSLCWPRLALGFVSFVAEASCARHAKSRVARAARSGVALFFAA